MSRDSKGSWVPDGAIHEQGKGILGTPSWGWDIPHLVLTLAIGEVAEGGQCGVKGGHHGVCVWWAEPTVSHGVGGTRWFGFLWHRHCIPSHHCGLWPLPQAGRELCPWGGATVSKVRGLSWF